VGFRKTAVHAEYYPELIEAITTKSDCVVNMLRSGKRFWKINDDEMMKIDAVIGNPPYQVMNKGEGNGSDPVYHRFLDLAMILAPQGSLVHPARFLFNAGKTPKEWNAKMLADSHYKVVDYWANSMEVFSTVDVKGGIATSYWNRDMVFTPIGLFTPFEELRGIKSKVAKFSSGSLADMVAPRELYRITDDLYAEHSEWESRQSKGHKYSFGANIFDVFPEIFFDECPQGKEDEMARVYGRANNERCYKWCKRSYITHPENFYRYKVILPKSNGSGAIGEVLSTPILGTPILGTPILGYTDTFISVGAFEERGEAEACLKYVKTRFARTMLGMLKVTQDNPKDTWRLVPLQDFTSSSDIDWSRSVDEIDAQLYRKYGLDPSEIAFIKEKVRPME